MATKSSRPFRTLLIFLGVIAVLFGGAAALGSWQPKLGLDLRGGTRITLKATALSGGVTNEKLQKASQIISSRVNGLGVSEASVTTQGGDIIVVEIPGKVDPDISKTIGETAQLRFRIVAKAIGPQNVTFPQPKGQPPAQPSPSSKPTGKPTPSGAPSSGAPSSGAPSPSASPSKPAQSEPTSAGGSPSSSEPAPSGSPASGNSTQSGSSTQSGTSGKKRAAGGWLTDDNGSGSSTPANDNGDSKKKKESEQVPQPAPLALQPPHLVQIKDPYKWVANPPQDWLQRLKQFKCGQEGPRNVDLPSQPLLACDEQGNRYLLGPAVVEGTHVTDASYGIPQNQVDFVVNVTFDDEGAQKFGEATKKLAKNNPSSPLSGGQMAIVLDGEVLSAPTNDEPIYGGKAQISGSRTNPFTRAQAASLANSLKYGALPLSFSVQQITDIGPELAGNQLDAGIFAGIIGLLLVSAYALFYYRGLFVVVVASLGIAGLLVYACVLLLGHAYGMTLTLPGIAGLIVAVGITADSFIVYFERLRDEVRDNKTLRTSVETGWARARQTILAADGVTLLAAVTLYIFAIGAVKGFAFTLGLTTVIDVFVVFFFTKPVVTLLARTKFYGKGHKFSGLDRAHLGMPPLRRRTRAAGGET